MLTVGCVSFSSLLHPLQPYLTHYSVDTLMVDSPTLPVQLSRDSTISIGWPFSSYYPDGLYQVLVLFIGLGNVVKTAPWIFQHLTGFLHRISSLDRHNHFPFLFACAFKMLEAFFSISFSMVRRPTNRSRSAIRF